MLEDSDRCPYLVPLIPGRRWVYPVPAYCRRPHDSVRIPGLETFVRLCTTARYATCPTYRASPSGEQRATG